MRRWAGVLAAFAVVVVLTGACVGTTSRERFEEIIRERGGGYVSELPLGAVDAVAEELGTRDFAIRNLSIDAAGESVTLAVRHPAQPEHLDTYLVRRGEIDSIDPVRLGDGDNLDHDTFPISQLALDRTEDMVDTALTAFDPDGGYVTSISASQVGDGNIVFTFSLESERASATAEFSAAGDLVEVTPT